MEKPITQRKLHQPGPIFRPGQISILTGSIWLPIWII